MTGDEATAPIEPDAGCPTDDELAQLAWGGTAVGVDVARHLETCASCRDRIAHRRREGRRAPATLAPGTMIGRFRIEECLGHGGMGVVYRATDQELDREVALKLVHPHARSIDELTERLRRESRLQARAAHRAVITVYDIGVAGDRVYVAMELIRGGTLRHWLERAPRSWRDVLDVFRDVAAGLAAAHAAGLVHRDVKPDNVLVELDPAAPERITRVLVTDFGVARAVQSVDLPTPEPNPADDLEMTQTGLVVGTPAYMSPEQLAGATVDPRSDVFSFSVAVWESLFGTRPFVGATPVELAAAMRAVPIPPARRGRDPVPAWVIGALRAGLAIHPAARTPSMADAMVALDWRRRARGRRRAIAAIAGGFLIGAGATAAVIATRDTASACETPERVGGALTRGAEQLTAALATGPADRGEHWRTTVGTYVAGWTALRTKACTARPPDVEARVRCLDASGAQTAALVAGAAALPAQDRQDALRGMSLAPPRECDSAAAAATAAMRPERPAVWDARLWMARIEGAQTSNTTIGAQVRAAVDAAKFPPLELELELLELRSSDDQQPSPAMRELVARAERAGHVQVAGRAALHMLAWVLSTEEPHARGVDLLAQASSAISRAGDPASERAHALVLDAWITADSGDVEAALIACKRAEELIADAQVPFDTFLMNHLASAYQRMGRADLGLPITERVLAYAKVMEDAADNQVFYLHGYAVNLLRVGRYADVRTALMPLLEGLDRTAKLPEPRLADLVEAISESYQNEGDPAAAYQWLHSWRPAVTATIDPHGISFGHYELETALALAQIGRYAEAERTTRAALEIFLVHKGADHPQTADVRILHGQLLLELGRLDHARDALERGVADRAKSGGDGHVRVAQGTFALAELELERGRRSAAQAHAERALANFQAAGAPAPMIGEARFLVARTILRADPERARNLIDEAVIEMGGESTLAGTIADAEALRAKLK